MNDKPKGEGKRMNQEESDQEEGFKTRRCQHTEVKRDEEDKKGGKGRRETMETEKE